MARLAEGRRFGFSGARFPGLPRECGRFSTDIRRSRQLPSPVDTFLACFVRGERRGMSIKSRAPLRRRCAGCSRCGDAACRGRRARSPLRHGRLYFVGKFEDSRVNTTLNFGASPDGSPALFEANVNCGARAGDRHSRIFPSICLAKLTGTTSPSNLPFLGRPSIISMQPAAAQRRTADRGAQAELRTVAAATDFGQRDTSY
jgi:hypothetical protein